jgi:hypothetical protein
MRPGTSLPVWRSAITATHGSSGSGARVRKDGGEALTLDHDGRQPTDAEDVIFSAVGPIAQFIAEGIPHGHDLLLKRPSFWRAHLLNGLASGAFSVPDAEGLAKADDQFAAAVPRVLEILTAHRLAHMVTANALCIKEEPPAPDPSGCTRQSGHRSGMR